MRALSGRGRGLGKLCGVYGYCRPAPAQRDLSALPTLPFDVVKANDEAEKPRVLQDQQSLLSQRYDLSNNPIPGVMTSGGRKAVQGGVRVKLPAGATWDALAGMRWPA